MVRRLVVGKGREPSSHDFDVCVVYEPVDWTRFAHAVASIYGNEHLESYCFPYPFWIDFGFSESEFNRQQLEVMYVMFAKNRCPLCDMRTLRETNHFSVDFLKEFVQYSMWLTFIMVNGFIIFTNYLLKTNDDLYFRRFNLKYMYLLSRHKNKERTVTNLTKWLPCCRLVLALNGWYHCYNMCAFHR